MKAFITVTSLLFILSGCNKTNSDQNFQDHQDKQNQQEHNLYYKDLKNPENIHSSGQGDV